jgi:hypothetical protein
LNQSKIFDTSSLPARTRLRVRSERKRRACSSSCVSSRTPTYASSRSIGQPIEAQFTA